MNTPNKQLADWANQESFLSNAQNERGMSHLRKNGMDKDINIIRKDHYKRYDRITKGKPVNPVTSFK